MTHVELRQFLSRSGLEAFDQVILDSEYALPAVEWLTGAFCEALRKNLFALGVEGYQAEAWDCDDFAWLTAALAKVNHRVNGDGSKRALAVGFFAYQRDVGGNHAIVMGICGTESAPEAVFIEPQTQARVYLSETERGSASTIII